MSEFHHENPRHWFETGYEQEFIVGIHGNCFLDLPHCTMIKGLIRGATGDFG